MADENDTRMHEDSDEQEDDGIDETAYKTVKDAVLFAIDVSVSMLSTPPVAGDKKADRDSATAAALKCAYALMQQRIISNPSDMMGILLFGTEQSKFQDDEGSSKTSLQYPHCYLLADLDVPAAADVKRLRSLAEDDEASKKFLIPSQEQVPMSNVLFCANQIFTTRAPNFASRRLFLVTDKDNPHAQSKDLRSSAIVRAKDLYDLGVIIELFPISRPGQDFDRGKFYDDIVYSMTPTDPEAPVPILSHTDPLSGKDGISLLTSLLTSINSRAVPRRALFSSVPLEIAPTLKISVKGYIIFKRQEPKPSCFIWLEGETPQIAVGKTTRQESDSARVVEKADITKAFKFGGENVTFAPEELVELRNFGDPVIRIIGFKPRSMLPIWANLRPATFIYPSEEEYIGSTRTFSALQQTLLRKDKIGIVWYIARRNAAPVIAALVPGPEKLGQQDEQILPPGLWIVPLPFADDIRQNPETTGVISAPDELIDKMRAVIQQLQLPKGVYDPSKYPNPTLQWHYRILQALALEEDLPEKPEDKTVPRYRQIHKRAGQYVIDWGVELDKQIRAWQQTNASARSGAKRPASQASTGLAKRTKTATDGGDELPSEAEIRTHFGQNTLEKLTVVALKSFAESKGIKPRMSAPKKANWVSEIEWYFSGKEEHG